MNMQGEKHIVIDSTQAVLKSLIVARPGLPHGYYVMAETQTAGRGRSDHVWNSAQGNLHVSILLKDHLFTEITWIPLWICTCIHRALVDLGVESSKLQIKWPNDIWIDGSKKIAGILCEKIGDTVIVGVGINLIQAPHAQAGVVPGEFSISPQQALEKILFGINSPTSTEEIKKYYEQYSLFKRGEKVKWINSSNHKAEEGVITGLGKFGELLVNIEEVETPLYSEEIHSVKNSTVPFF